MGLPRLRMLVTCDAAAPDPTGKLTLYGIFDTIWAKAFPAAHPRFVVAVSCYVDETTKLRLRLERPDGSPLVTTPAVEVNPSEMSAVQATYHLDGVLFPTEGTYRIALLANEGTEVASCNLRLVKRQNTNN
jgi:hypothetical protein